jgi:hypothetical protein
MEIVESIYAPDAPIAGGGAENFIKNRTNFFAGEFAKGRTRESILKDLSRRRLPYADVILGFCGGKNKVVDENGKEKNPPCIGGMKCNPVNCSNSLITVSKKLHWERSLEHNKKMLNDPLFFYAKDSLIAFIKEAENVLKILNNENS